MQFDLNDLPSDTALLHSLVRDMASAVEHRDDEIERLQLIIKQLQRARFGRRSERIDAEQLGRKNHLFAGSDIGGQRWATLSSIIETCLCRKRHRAVYAARRTMPSGFGTTLVVTVPSSNTRTSCLFHSA